MQLIFPVSIKCPMEKSTDSEVVPIDFSIVDIVFFYLYFGIFLLLSYQVHLAFKGNI